MKLKFDVAGKHQPDPFIFEDGGRLYLYVAAFVMPFLNLALFFAVEMIIHLIFWGFGGHTAAFRPKSES